MENNNSSSPGRTRAPKKPKKSQIPYAILLTVLIIGLGMYLSTLGVKLPAYLMFGVAFGYVLQRSRFCFTAALRDPWITGSTSLTRAVLIACGLAAVGFAAIKFHSAVSGADQTLAMAGVSPIGLPLMIGGVLFGTGMVISGGCASGTLMRVGEGFTMQMLSLVFFVIGSLWGAHDMTFWDRFNVNAPKIFLPDVFGWFGGVVVQAGIIVLLYIAALKWQEKKMGSME